MGSIYLTAEAAEKAQAASENRLLKVHSGHDVNDQDVREGTGLDDKDLCLDCLKRREGEEQRFRAMELVLAPIAGHATSQLTGAAPKPGTSVRDSALKKFKGLHQPSDSNTS